ncbi:hypothetical protein KUA09_07200 [Proteus mirabilis]|nr:hypothetical protein [Proteus mirabilis]
MSGLVSCLNILSHNRALRFSFLYSYTYSMVGCTGASKDAPVYASWCPVRPTSYSSPPNRLVSVVVFNLTK